MKPAFNILLIEDNPGDARLIEIQLHESERTEVNLEHAATLAAGRERLARGGIDLVLLDLGLPDSLGLETLVKTKAMAPHVPVVVLTGTSDVELAVQAVRQGAQDYLVKGQVNSFLLERAVRYAIERAQADEKIAYLASFPEMNPNPVAEVDREGRVHYMNSAAKRVFPDLEQLGLSHPLLAETGAVNECFESGGSSPVTREFTAGSAVYLMAFQCIGNTQRLRIYGVDITERRRAEAALRQSEERFRVLFEEAADSIFLLEITPEGVPMISDANSATFTLLGYERDELIGQPVSIIEAEPDALKVVDQRRQNVRSGLGAVFEARHRCKDGTIRDFECSVKEMQIGSKTFGISVERDITERKRMEEALRESEEFHKNLINSIPEGVIITDLEGNITYFSRLVGLMYGSEDASALWGQSLFQFIPPEEQEQARELYTRVLGGEVVSNVEATLVRKDGTRYPVDISGLARWDAESKPTAVLLVVRDLTEKKKAEQALREAEEQLRQAQKLESIGQLAGGVAHDFNNILGAILGYSEMLLGPLREGDPMRNDILEIRKAAERAAGLTRQLLAFSRRQPLAPKVLDLNEVISGCEKMLKRLIGENIELTVFPDGGLWCTKADPGQIEQVIMNLAVNARDAMPDGGKLTIETHNVALDEEYTRTHVDASPGDHVMLAASDTGCGMDAETLARIFEPFFTTKEKGKGTGLGLSTVYGIVKQSGGNIWVYSEPGKGTTFKIYLPRTDEAAEMERAPAPEHAAAAPTETVLVVEDDEMLRALVVRQLESAGYKVLQAANGGEAMLACERHQGAIHLLVTDVIMPLMNGKDLSERLLTACPEMKVLFTSGYTDNAIVHHGVLEAGVHFLQKPFSAVDLRRKVREVLGAPAAPRKAAAVPVPDSAVASAAAPAAARKRGRILVVDDEVAFGSMITRLLRTEHDVTATTSGEEARAIIEDDRGFDVILCDLHMPGMSGKDLHQWISTSAPELVDRLVFMSGGEIEPGDSTFLEEIAKHRLDKPFDNRKLRELVRGMVDGTR